MRVVIAEDSILLRDGLIRLLAANGIEVVEAVGDAEAALVAVERHLPDLDLLDVRMPPSHTDEGLRAALVLRTAHPDLAVLVLSQYVEQTYAAELLGSGQGTGIGYLLKERIGDVGEFVDALVRIAEGGTVIDPEVVRQLLSGRRDPLRRLTPRELEVLALIAEGRANASIARALFVTDAAVAKHIASIFAKLDLPPAADGHRRVLAVLAYLQAEPR